MTEQEQQEQSLIEITRQYLNCDIDNTQSEILNNELFRLAELLPNPRTQAGRAIVAYVRQEIATDFSLACNDEFEAMQKAVHG